MAKISKKYSERFAALRQKHVALESPYRQYKENEQGERVGYYVQPESFKMALEMAEKMYKSVYFETQKFGYLEKFGKHPENAKDAYRTEVERKEAAYKKLNFADVFCHTNRRQPGQFSVKSPDMYFEMFRLERGYYELPEADWPNKTTGQAMGHLQYIDWLKDLSKLAIQKKPESPKTSPLSYDTMFRDKDHAHKLIKALQSPQCEKLDSSGKWQTDSKLDLLGLIEFLIDNNYLKSKIKAHICRVLVEKFEAEPIRNPHQTVTADYVFQYDFLRNHLGN